MGFARSGQTERSRAGLNPDSEVGFDMEPETMQDLIQQLAGGETQH